MKLANATIALVMMLLLTITSESALARGSHGGRSGGGHSGGGHSGGSHFSGGGGHFGGSRFSGRHFIGPPVRFGVIVGAPAFWFYPPPPPYYYPPLVAMPSSPPVYIEQGAAQYPPAQPGGYWYFCADAQAYYPYVKECPGGWQSVAPQPSPGP